MKKKNASPEDSGKIISVDFVKGNFFNAENAKATNVVGKKIEEARTSLGLSKNELRNLLQMYGVTAHKDIIGRWERGDTVPSSYQLLALSFALMIDDGISYFSDHEDLNMVGMKKLSEYKKDLIATGLYAPIPAEPSVEYIDMPLSYLSVSAGTGAFLDEGNYEMISVPKSKVPQGAQFGIRVRGDSMEPTYNDGQLIWVQQTKELNPGEVGVFFYGDQGFMKSYGLREPSEELRSEFTDIDGAVHLQPVLISFNKKYDPIYVTPDTRFEIVGRVLN